MSKPRLPTRSAAKPEALSRPSTRSGPPAAERPTGADSSLPDPRSSLAPAKPCEAGIPFSVHREGQATLTDQIVRGLAHAIRSGHYADGQKLPTIMGLSEALGVSDIVVRTAVKRLSAMGLVVARRKDGIRARRADATPPWRAHVLQLARANHSSFYYAVRDGVMQEELRRAQVRLSSLLVDTRESDAGFPGVLSFADDDPPDLAILEGPSWGVLSVLEKRNIPFVHIFAPKPSAKARGTLSRDDEPGLRELVKRATACRLRSVLGVFCRNEGEASHFEEAACGAGLECRILSVTPDASRPNPESMEFGGLSALAGFLRGNATRPEWIHFSDDFLARGGLMALLAAGLRVPEDVQVSTLANRGNRIAFPKALTCRESNPEEAGRAIAKLVLHALDHPDRRKDLALPGARFVAGETLVRTQPL